MALDLPPFSSFDEQQPETFYLGRPEGEIAALADATLVAGKEGREMLVHSQVLSLHSGVLRSLFAAQREKDKQDSMCVSQPFASHPARTVAAFLRCLYFAEHATPAAFEQLPWASLHGVVRLAHQLDVPSLLSKLDDWLSETVTNVSVEDAVRWAQLAEECHLARLRVRCIRQIAARLSSGGAAGQSRYPGGPYSSVYAPGTPSRRSGAAASGTVVLQAVADASELKELSQDAVLGVLGACVAAMRRYSVGQDRVPGAAELEAALLHK